MWYNIRMKNKRYYVENEIRVGSCIKLEGEEFLHLSRVMRTRVGEYVTLFCGNNFDYEARVKEITKNYAMLDVLSETENNLNPATNVTLFQALVKGDKLSTIVQKNTELGTREIILFESEFSDVKVGNKNLDKQKRVVISALKQCGASTLTLIDKELKFSEMLKELSLFDKIIFAYECEESNNISDVIKTINRDQKIAVIVGAEGGFSEKEAKAIKEAGAISTKLGKRILRAETAGIVLPGMIILSLEK